LKIDTEKSFVSKSKKGVFKNSGTILTEAEVEEELLGLNPYTRNLNKNLKLKQPPKNGYLRTVNTQDVKEASDDDSVEVVEEVWKYPNSTGTFVPPYWMFGFKDNLLRSYLCLTINIPSGVCHSKWGLEGKVEAKVTTCCGKLTVACEWPETMVMATCLQDCLSTEWDTNNNNNIATQLGTSSTVSNILLAFETELHKMRTKNRVTSSTMLGATCTIPLPYLVERQMVLCAPNLDPDVGSVNLYIVLRKQCTARDELGSTSMAVRISNGYKKNVTIKKEKGFGQANLGSTGYYYDSEDTLDEYEALKLQKKQKFIKNNSS
jgi:hypothetical protein